jgi:hypothetical protein
LSDECLGHKKARYRPASRPSTTCTNWRCAPPCGKKAGRGELSQSDCDALIAQVESDLTTPQKVGFHRRGNRRKGGERSRPRKAVPSPLVPKFPPLSPAAPAVPPYHAEKGRVPPPGEPAKGTRTIPPKKGRSVPTWSPSSHLFRLRPRRCRPTTPQKVGFHRRGNRRKGSERSRPRRAVPSPLGLNVLISFARGPGGAALPRRKR